MCFSVMSVHPLHVGLHTRATVPFSSRLHHLALRCYITDIAVRREWTRPASDASWA